MYRKIFSKITKKMFAEQKVELENIAIQNGKILEQLNKNKSISSLNDTEFKVFSQFGEDGIIAYIVNILEGDIENKTFIEFGVENYQESNTRYLMMSKNWNGIIIDGSNDNINYVKSSYYFWRYNLRAISKFITMENIDTLLKENLPENQTKVGILSIDVDGNDYYIFDAIKSVIADILILEYNSVFEDKRSVTIPYDSKFYRYDKSFTGAYFGASIIAMISKAEEKGYCFIGTNSAGHNAFFVRNVHVEKFSHLSKGFNLAKFRQPTTVKNKEMLTQKECLYEIKDLPVIDLEANGQFLIGELYGLCK